MDPGPEGDDSLKVAAVQAIDDMVGEVYAKLDDSGLVFTWGEKKTW